MSRITPLKMESLPAEAKHTMLAGMELMGFAPNDGLIMAHQPPMLHAFLSLVEAVYQPGTVSLELKKLVALMTSSASGCQYCQAHTQHGALETGVSAEKVAAIWRYSDDPLFSEAERAALEVARSAALVPNGVDDAMFDELKRHFNDAQIVELVGVISLFGFLNRWNATFDTDLEEVPQASVSALAEVQA